MNAATKLQQRLMAPRMGFETAEGLTALESRVNHAADMLTAGLWTLEEAQEYAEYGKQPQ